jgi:hypothetical protein
MRVSIEKMIANGLVEVAGERLLNFLATEYERALVARLFRDHASLDSDGIRLMGLRRSQRLFSSFIPRILFLEKRSV